MLRSNGNVRNATLCHLFNDKGKPDRNLVVRTQGLTAWFHMHLGEALCPNILDISCLYILGQSRSQPQ